MIAAACFLMAILAGVHAIVFGSIPAALIAGVLGLFSVFNE
jgi:hypothetical protein